MQPQQAIAAAASPRTQLNPALAGFADEVVGTLARLVLYVGALALLAMLAMDAWSRLATLPVDEPGPRPHWAPADRSRPAFAVSSLDSRNRSETSEAYTILRHSEGGRRDVMRWTDHNGRRLAELEIYRAGGEFDPNGGSELASRMGLAAAAPLEQAGVIDSKFGPIVLFRPGGAAAAAAPCLGYLGRVDEPALQISGWSCQGDSLPARRAAVACLVNRLTMLNSGNEPRLADLFARAELRRRPCEPEAPGDWVNSAGNAQLRGAL